MNFIGAATTEAPPPYKVLRDDNGTHESVCKFNGADFGFGFISMQLNIKYPFVVELIVGTELGDYSPCGVDSLTFKPLRR